MSLVNDMLRDLDRRRQLPVQAHRIGRVIDIADEEPRSRAVQLALVVVASLATGLAGGYLLMERPANTTQDLMQSIAAPAARAPVPAAGQEPSALQESSAVQEPSAIQEPSALQQLSDRSAQP